MLNRLPSIRIIVLLFLSVLLCSAIGCELLSGKKKEPNISETPPYYNGGQDVRGTYAQPDSMPSKLAVSPRGELEKLENYDEDFWPPLKKDQAKNEQSQNSKEKKGFWSRMESGDKTPLMSSEAKEIHQRLER